MTASTKPVGRALAALLLAAALPVAVNTAQAHAADGDTCAASWYGAPGEIPPGWPTASGEPFDPEAMTAASRDLPFDTEVKVTNVDNGQFVTVRINDRGPTDTSRCIDLTRGAFDVIAPEGQGLATVSLEIVGG